MDPPVARACDTRAQIAQLPALVGEAAPSAARLETAPSAARQVAPTQDAGSGGASAVLVPTCTLDSAIASREVVTTLNPSIAEHQDFITSVRDFGKATGMQARYHTLMRSQDSLRMARLLACQVVLLSCADAFHS